MPPGRRLEKAREIGAKTERERGWTDAPRLLPRPRQDRRRHWLRAHNTAMKEWRSATRRLRGAGRSCADVARQPKTDLTYANQLQSVAILRSCSSRTCSIRACRIIIHAYDFPPLADRIAAAALCWHCRRSRTHAICPRTSIPWSGCGRSRDPSNSSAPKSARLLPCRRFTVYAHLQLAQDGKAKALTAKRRYDPAPGIARWVPW
jgi:hypothetical protein